jgi:hypothetical protein
MENGDWGRAMASGSVLLRFYGAKRLEKSAGSYGGRGEGKRKGIGGTGPLYPTQSSTAVVQ